MLDARPCRRALRQRLRDQKVCDRALGIGLRKELRDVPSIRVCTLLPAAVDTPIYQRAVNYTGWQAKAVPPVYDPYCVGEVVLSVIRRPQDEVVIGGFGRLVARGILLAPGSWSTVRWR